MTTSTPNGYTDDEVTASVRCVNPRLQRILDKWATLHPTIDRKSPEYLTWRSLFQRCYNEKAHNYARYGGRGIKVCRRWQRSFTNFLADVGPRTSKEHSLERKNNDGNYTKNNCVWATRKEQARNTRRNRTVTCWGKTACVAEWAEKLGMSYKTIQGRLDRGWSPEEAFTVMPIIQGDKRTRMS